MYLLCCWPEYGIVPRGHVDTFVVQSLRKTLFDVVVVHSRVFSSKEMEIAKNKKNTDYFL